MKPRIRQLAVPFPVVSGQVVRARITQVTVRPRIQPTSLPGRSAYEIALANGFDGSEVEWLASLGGGGVGAYRGIWDADTEYSQGDVVTRNYSLYSLTAESSTGEEPGTGGHSDPWFLMVAGLGGVLPVWRGEYDEGVDYQIGNLVTFERGLYYCFQEPTTGAFDGSHWDLLASTSQFKRWRGEYNSHNNDYLPGDVTYYAGGLYFCVAPTGNAFDEMAWSTMQDPPAPIDAQYIADLLGYSPVSPAEMAAADAVVLNAAAADATAKANAASAVAVQRANHTGTQSQSTIVGLVADLAAKADLVGGVVPTSQIPEIAITRYLGSVASQAAMLALSGQVGDWAIRSDLAKVYIITGADPTQLADWTAVTYPASPVASVNGQVGVVVLGATDVGADPAGSSAAALASAIAALAAHAGTGGTAHANVVAAGAAGFMTGADKSKLDAITGTNTGDQASVTGNAGTATALQTARNIDGQSFNGSADITVIAPGTHAATSKATPVDADELPLVDSAASNGLKKVTWANLKAGLRQRPPVFAWAGGGTYHPFIGTSSGTRVGFVATAERLYYLWGFPIGKIRVSNPNVEVPASSGVASCIARAGIVEWDPVNGQPKSTASGGQRIDWGTADLSGDLTRTFSNGTAYIDLDPNKPYAIMFIAGGGASVPSLYTMSFVPMYVPIYSSNHVSAMITSVGDASESGQRTGGFDDPPSVAADLTFLTTAGANFGWSNPLYFTVEPTP